MKNKRILKILGIGLSLMLVFSLGAVFMAAPIAADDDEWSEYDFPAQGDADDYFLDVLIADGPGPIVRSPVDDTFWAFAVPDTGLNEILHSTDTEGRSWELTEAAADIGAVILDIVCSTVDADVAYAATAAEVWKTEDGGDSWDQVGDFANAIVLGEFVVASTINLLAVGWDDDDDPRVFIGTTGGATDEIGYLYDVPWGDPWNNLNVAAGAGVVDIWGLNVSPNFTDDAFQAVLCEDGTDTWIAYHTGSAPGGWADVNIDDDSAGDGDADGMSGTGFVATGGSDPQFPEDFDGADFYDGDQEIFVGIEGPLHSAGLGLGGVVRICGVDPECREILDAADLDAEIATLAIVGNVGNTQLLAGTSVANGALPDVWYSYDDGDEWDSAVAEGIQPAGPANTDTYVIMDGDFDEEEGIAWAATDALAGADEACLSMSIDGAVSWQGVGLINTNSAALNSFVVQTSSPETVWWLSDDTATRADLFRYDEDGNWERVFEENQYAVAAMNAVDAYDDTTLLYVAGVAGNTEIYFSDDGGQIFADTDEEACDGVGDGIQCLLMLDEETWWVGDTATAGGGDLWVTDDAGDRCWDGPYDIDPAAAITSLAVSGDTAIAGDLDCEAYYSEDEGETWDQVDTGTRVDATGGQATYVCFDPEDDNIMYAATDDTIARFTDLSDLDEDWEAWDFEADEAALFDGTSVILFNGIACMAGTTLYVSDVMPVDTDPLGNAGVTLDAAGGLWRCTNPLTDLDDADESQWDWVSDGLALTGVDNFDGLQVNASSPNVLWANDTSLATLWTYDDLLVGPVTGLVCDPGDDEFTLTWDELSGNATDWELLVYENEDMTAAYELYDSDTADDDPVARIDGVGTPAGDVLAPEAGTQYWVQVRASEPVHSKWSEVFTFNTSVGQLAIDEDIFAPPLGATNVSITPSFGWENLSAWGADSYIFEFSDTADFSNIIETEEVTDPTYSLTTALEYNTNYFWRVKVITGATESAWAYGTFTTRVAPVVAPTPPAPAAAAEITIPPTQMITPGWIYAIIAIGASLAGLVIYLIVRTRRP